MRNASSAILTEWYSADQLISTGAVDFFGVIADGVAGSAQVEVQDINGTTLMVFCSCPEKQSPKLFDVPVVLSNGCYIKFRGTGSYGIVYRKMFMDNTVLAEFKKSGPMFFEDYRQLDPITADIAGGSGVATHTVNRDATTPATYFDKNGVMQLMTTNNKPRLSWGYYDETGWHSAPGWLLEGASTNSLTYSINSVDSNSDGQAEGVVQSGASTVTGTPTYTLVDATDVSSISGHKWQRVQYTGVAGDSSGTRELAIAAGITPTSFCVQGNKVTFSVTLKGSVTGCTYYMQALESDAAGAGTGTLIQSAAITVYSTPIRVHHTHTIVDAACTRVYFRPVQVKHIGTSDTIDVYFTNQQVELQAYPSSFIPTTTAALTRNAETTNTYTTAGNFPAPSGGNCLSFDGQNASGDDYVSIANSATGNQAYGSTAYSVDSWVFIRSDGEGDGGRIVDKTDASSDGLLLRTVNQSGANVAIAYSVDRSGGDDAICITAVSVATNTWHHIVGSWNGGDGVGNAPKLYIDNAELSYTGTPSGGSGAFIDESLRNMFIGNNAAGTRTFDGFIQSTRIYRDKALTANEVAQAYGAGRYASQPVPGCTAEYLFNEGTGTTLTDSVADNDGTISGATWSKDTLSGTIMVKFRPICLIAECVTAHPSLFLVSFDAGANTTNLLYTKAGGYYYGSIKSNSTGYDIGGWVTGTIDRYSSHTGIFVFSSGQLEKFYFDGVLKASGTISLSVPAGILPATFQIQTSAGQAMILEELAVWGRVLSADEALYYSSLPEPRI